MYVQYGLLYLILIRRKRTAYVHCALYSCVRVYDLPFANKKPPMMKIMFGTWYP